MVLAAVCPICDKPAHGPAGTYRLPARFYYDHVERDCLAGTVQRETKQHVYVTLDGADYCDIYSDAVYYSDASQFDREYRGLCASARATVAALQGAPL